MHCARSGAGGQGIDTVGNKFVWEDQRESQSTKHEPMLDSTRDALRLFYEPFIRELYALVGRDFKW